MWFIYEDSTLHRSLPSHKASAAILRTAFWDTPQPMVRRHIRNYPQSRAQNYSEFSGKRASYVIACEDSGTFARSHDRAHNSMDLSPDSVGRSMSTRAGYQRQAWSWNLRAARWAVFGQDWCGKIRPTSVKTKLLWKK